ncbi:MAG: FIST C-terminal domain-containing protein [Coriobacteriales bacterium]|jgi:hypothetical protein|nr:FIST C-terminal domain-containing protein [Coriobacteriales bacterium]
MAVTLRVAFTEEIDEPDSALEEILGQLKPDELKAHTLGILYCCVEFVESGVATHIARELPFDVVGMSSMASASLADKGLYRLTLAVLTSDDARFATVSTAPLSADNYQQAIAEAWQEAVARTEAPACFAIGFLPFLRDIAGQEILDAFDAASGCVPLWGSIASGSDMTYADCCTIHNERAEQQSATFALIEGAIEPEFVVTSIPERNIYEHKAVITKSQGCVLSEVNDTPVLDYMHNLGILFNQGDQTTIPLMIDYRDGSQPIALAMYAFLDDGSILCGGSMPEGALLSLGEIDSQGILETAQTSLDELLALTDKSGFLLCPCSTRFMMLAPRQEDEMAVVIERLEGAAPYMLGYSGGELCPVKAEDGSWRNRFHNFTFTACAL